MAEKHGALSINSDNIFPIIKKWLYSDHDIFYRELISNGCDVIFVPNDAIVQDGVQALSQVCEEAGIPTYCSSATTVNSGCLATLAIDDKGIGAKTADKCLEYLNGTDITAIPAEVVGIDYCTFNGTVAQSLGIETPTADTIGYEIQVVE